jgi:hypothetical protein
LSAHEFSDGSDEADDVGSSTGSSRGGRPQEHDVQENDLRECCEAGMTETEITGALGLTAGQIKYLKAKWGLHGVAEASRSRMSPLEELQAWWNDDPTLSLTQVAQHAGVSERALRNHCQRIGFDPKSMSAVPDEIVIAALHQFQSGPCSDLGVTFAIARLSRECNIVATQRQVRRCLKVVDPGANRRRAAAMERTRYIYTVAGPRSLYHCDAHEKLAKIWGFWIHLCIDGYSRYIIYLTVLPNKQARAVGQLFTEACNKPWIGWASRVRWDRGKENVQAIEAQWTYWWDWTKSDEQNRKRGSALTGRSVQNCRAEYIWAYVRKHISNFYRKLFWRMEKDWHS